MDLEIKQLIVAIKAISEEKNLPEDIVTTIIEQALAAAWRRDNGDREQNVRAKINLANGTVDIFVDRTVVEEVENSLVEISLSDAQKIKSDAKIDDIISDHHVAETFGRVAAQTAKQVIIQKVREAERDIVMAEYEDKIGTIINGIVSRIEGRLIKFDIGKIQGIMPSSEQIQGERYFPGQRLKVYLKDIDKGNKGPQLLLSRGCPEFIELLFKAEVPEMSNGSVEIKKISREAGVRSKIAVTSSVQGVDPVGTFVGGHGTRVQAVMGEIGDNEKIDIVVWSPDTETFIKNALSPTQVESIIINEEHKKAVVNVVKEQLSVAIGRSGQNVRLASKLTGYEIDIKSDAEKPQTFQKPVEQKPSKPVEKTSSTPAPKPKLKRKDEIESSLLDAIEELGSND